MSTPAAHDGPADGPPALVFEDVVLVESRMTLLGPLSWSVGADERWVILGPNGAGKTSLMRLASATRIPSKGKAWVLGHQLGRVHLGELRKRIGFMSDELLRRFEETRTALEVVTTAVHGAMRWWRQDYGDQDWVRGRSLLEAVGCSELADRPLQTMSEGERQRVLLARALMPEPDLVLLDEPTAGMDLGGREQFVQLLDRFTASSIPPVVLVTHHVEEIPSGFTHALLLRAGQATAAGPIEDVLTDERLSSCFGLSLRVHCHEGRYSVTAGPRTAA